MAFTATEKVNIRRYCGYYLFGGNPVQSFAWRYTDQYGHLEFVMNNMQTEEETVVRTVYLPNLALLESDIPAVRENLDTKQAAVWYWNEMELSGRIKLYTYWCKQLAGFMGVGNGPNLSSGTSFVV